MKNPSTGRRRWKMRTNGWTYMQLMDVFRVLRESAWNSPKTCTVNSRNVTYVRIKYISTTDNAPYNTGTGRGEIKNYMHSCLFHFLKSRMTHEHKMCDLLSPTVFIPNTLHCNKISGELSSSYGRHVRRNGCLFWCELSITAAWFFRKLECFNIF